MLNETNKKGSAGPKIIFETNVMLSSFSPV